MSEIDLHIHSNFSEDADFSIEEIFKIASSLAMKAIAITDHDSVESINAVRYSDKKHNLICIPGVELTTVFEIDNTQQHILGYNVCSTDKQLLIVLNEIQQFRKEIADKRIKALIEIGFNLDTERISKNTNNRPPTAASIMSEVFNNQDNINDKRLGEYFNGSKSDNKLLNFYREFLSEGKPAYIQFKSISTETGINTIKNAGGIPVLAHPVFLKNNSSLDILKEMGIAGIEAISTYHDEKQNNFYFDYCLKNNLKATSGSDFHGPTTKPKIKIGSQADYKFDFLANLGISTIKK